MPNDHDDIRIKEECALDDAYLYADIVFSRPNMEANLGQGLNNMATMPLEEFMRLARSVAEEGREDPEVAAHSNISLMFLLREAVRDKIHDSMTQIYSRSYIIDRISSHIEQMARDPSVGGAVIFLDLDRFKQINDTLGHPAGDAAIIRAAHKIADVARKSDIAARMGGDEFAVFMPYATKEEAQALTARLREEFADTTFKWEGQNVPIYASIGAVHILPGQSVDDVLKSADVALYEDKFNKPHHKNKQEKPQNVAQVQGALVQKEPAVYVPALALARLSI